MFRVVRIAFAMLAGAGMVFCASAQAQTTATRVLVGISPTSATLAPGQTLSFRTLISPYGSGVTWSVEGVLGGNATVGTISATGTYTAPAVPPATATATVTVTIASVLDPTKKANAKVKISNPGVTVSPTTAALTGSQTKQFVSNMAVIWSVSGGPGTISSSGLYTAPSSITSVQTATVKATSTIDATKYATATVSLAPPVSTTSSISISPAAGVTLKNGQSQLFVATVMETSNTLVTWSLSAAIGTISSAGLYTAPAAIASAQSVVVRATSVADPTKSVQAMVSLAPDSAPPSVSLTSPSGGATVSGSVTLSATAGDDVAVAGVRFLVDGVAVGPELTTAPYTASWYTNSVANGSHTIRVIVRDVAGLTAAQSVSVTVANSVTKVTLPVEVVGPAGTIQSANVDVTSPGSGVKLWMQIHNLKYQTEASVQINNGAWIPLNDSTVTLQGLAKAYGGIGGGFSTLKLTVNVPDGLLVSGSNRVSFRFNGTDNVTSGFRVLKFNFLSAAGAQMVNADTFLQDDPDTWQSPSTLTTDITAGQTLWRTANLTAPGRGAIKAKCASCHAQDGRDLKYFNYSNGTIRTRAMFHGLSATQGDQIASYIRSLSVPNPGRPWNPPYQPGPGLDSRPVEEWAAGAGLEAVLATDSEMEPYLVPGGSTAGWAASAYLNPRELPISLELPDWNQWLPQVHPMDAYGSTFVEGGCNSYYGLIRKLLTPGGATAYREATSAFSVWPMECDEKLLLPLWQNADWAGSDARRTVYSVVLWRMTKLWEMNQEFGLEAMPSAKFGSKANVRGWIGNEAFNTSPNMQHIPAGTGLGNGKLVTRIYLSLVWYQLQLILNDGQGRQAGHNPIDFPYVFAFIKDLSNNSGNSPGAMLLLEWMVKSLQSQVLTGTGPEKGALGLQLTANNPIWLVHPGWAAVFSATPSARRIALSESYLRVWLPQVSTYSPTQYYTGGWAKAAENPATLDPTTRAGGELWYALPRLRYYGVSRTLTGAVSAWARTIWPLGNWTLNDSAACDAYLRCTSD